MKSTNVMKGNYQREKFTANERNEWMFREVRITIRKLVWSCTQMQPNNEPRGSVWYEGFGGKGRGGEIFVRWIVKYWRSEVMNCDILIKIRYVKYKSYIYILI